MTYELSLKVVSTTTLIPVDIAVAWTPDEVRNAVMGAYLATSYGLVGLALTRQADQLKTQPIAEKRPVGHQPTSQER